MKRITYSILTFAAIGSLAWLSIDIAELVHARKALTMRIQQLPRIEVSDLSGRRLSTAAISDRPTILLFFRTNCPYCRDEIADLVAHQALFDGSNVLLISGERPGVLRRFASELKIESRTNFTLAIDDKGVLARHYGIRKIPALFVYDGAGKLLRRYDGLTRAETVAAVLKETSYDRSP